jgi:hypothetical protein
MSTGAYGIEAIGERQAWIVKDFRRLTARIGHGVAGTVGSTKKDDAIREPSTPPIELPWIVGLTGTSSD